jgi:glucose-6-phosphate isomerase
VLPYNESLKYFPSFLQQLEMESNGKSVEHRRRSRWRPEANPDRLGRTRQQWPARLLPACCIRAGAWCPVISSPPYAPTTRLPGHQEALLANCFAQSAALAFGKTSRSRHVCESARTVPAGSACRLLPHKVFAGNQPSSTLLLSRLDPQTLGRAGRTVRAQGVCARRHLGPQLLRPVGRRAGQGRGQQHPAGDCECGAGEKLDASTQGLLAFSRKHLA